MHKPTPRNKQLTYLSIICLLYCYLTHFSTTQWDNIQTRQRCITPFQQAQLRGTASILTFLATSWTASSSKIGMPLMRDRTISCNCLWVYGWNVIRVIPYIYTYIYVCRERVTEVAQVCTHWKKIEDVCKNRRPYNLYCVGADVKPSSINQSSETSFTSVPALQHTTVANPGHVNCL